LPEIKESNQNHSNPKRMQI